MTNKSNAKETPEGWQMACDLLVGTRQAITKCRAEYDAGVAANPDKLFVAGVASIRHTLETLIDVEKSLDFELSRTGRSNGWAVPRPTP